MATPQPLEHPSAPALEQYGPLLSDAGLTPSYAVLAVDEFGEQRDGFIAGEQPLTLFIDKREVVTLMTLGTHPELLVLGYLRNQRLVPCLESIHSIQVDWETDACAVTTVDGIGDLEDKLRHKTVTSGCGQGTVFGKIADYLDRLHLAPVTLRQSDLYAMLEVLNEHNEVYRRAGAVHGCALCSIADGTARVELFVEDVGRHNAADALSGHMWLDAVEGHDKIFYTTGRLTSEMVIKVAQMGIPVVVSRSGVTQKGLEFARKIGVTMIARAKGRHFLIYNGAEQVLFDAVPDKRQSAKARA